MIYNPTQNRFAPLFAFIAFTFSTLIATPLSAQETEVPAFRCAPVFGNGMVLQQGMPIPVWGWADPETSVTVALAGNTESVTTGKEGRWQLKLPALSADKLTDLSRAPEGRVMTVKFAKGEKVSQLEFSDVLIGEVWLCSGQSNMAGKIKHNTEPEGGKDDLGKSHLPAMRQVMDDRGWLKATPPDVRWFVRVGFCFGREIHKEEKVPIGLLNASVGGSAIEAWMPRKPEGLPERKRGRQPQFSGNFKKHVEPLVGYGMRGALWYQGEANATEGYEYFLKMQHMIADWRNLWSIGEFPFYYVQLAGIGESPSDNPAMGDGRARIREAQRLALKIPNTGMGTAIDIGAPREHPPNKKEIGIRLAQWARRHVYDKTDVVPSGPLYQSYSVEGNKIRIRFDFSKGLMKASKANYQFPEAMPEADLPWLSIQGQDGIWHWAKAAIESSDLIVWSEKVMHPKAVRYAFTNRPLGVYLYNGAGLPASPFTTEKLTISH